MSKEETICDAEFDKWWPDFKYCKTNLKYHAPEGGATREFSRIVWNKAWKTCAGKIVEAVREYKHTTEL